MEGDELRLVFVGKTGSGKSSTASIIAGKKDVFKASPRGLSMTTTCQCERAQIFGQKLLLVDTPGIFDTQQSHADVEREIGKFVNMSAPGPHAVLFVISAATRFTQEEVAVIEMLQEMFGEAIEKYLIIVVTRTEDWEDDGMDVMTYLDDLLYSAKRVLRTCIALRRVVAFKNNFTRGGSPVDTDQVMELLTLVKNTVRRNGNKCYTEAHWKKAEEKKRREQEILRIKRKKEKERINKIEEEKRLALERDYKERLRKQEIEREERERREREAQAKREEELRLKIEQMQLENERQVEIQRAEERAKAEEERKRAEQCMEVVSLLQRAFAEALVRQMEKKRRQQERMYRLMLKQQQQAQEREHKKDLERLWEEREACHRAWEEEQESRRRRDSCSIL